MRKAYKPSVERMRQYAAFEGYHRFIDEDGAEYGSFEVFFIDEPFVGEFDEECGPGWYWSACFPGCLPDGAPNGPFSSSRAAWRDARES